jgi:hypothetical protein
MRYATAFHALHPGNLFADDAGELVAVDFGIMGRLGRRRASSPRSCSASSARNYYRTAEVHFEPTCRRAVDRELCAGDPRHRRAVHKRTAEISMAKLFMLLFEIGLFDMRTRPELLLLQKTMVVVEGVARARSQASYVDGGGAGGARMIGLSRPGRQGRERRRGRSRSAAFSAMCRAPLSRGAGRRAARRHDPQRPRPGAETVAGSGAPRRGATAG